MRANIREKKKVPADIKRRWNSRFKKTRLIDIAKGSGLNIMTVSDAVSKGMATYATIDKINAFAEITSLVMDVRDRTKGAMSASASFVLKRSIAEQHQFIIELKEQCNGEYSKAEAERILGTVLFNKIKGL